MSITIKLLIIAATVVLSGVFVAAEVAVLTARRRMLGQAATLARFLPTLQVASTLLVTVGSVIGGATLTGPLSERLAKSSIGIVAANHAVIALTLVVLGLTFAVLVVGQFVPRQLARSNAEVIARRLPRPVAAVQTILRPLVWLPEAVGHLVLRCLGAVLPRSGRCASKTSST